MVRHLTFLQLATLVISLSFTTIGSDLSYSAQKVWKVDLAQDTMTNDWRVDQVAEIERGLHGRKNIIFFSSDAKANTTCSIFNIENMIAMDIDILIASPRDAKTISPVLDQAYRSGINVIMLSRRRTSKLYITFIRPDHEKIARQAVKYMAKRIRGKGNIVMLQGVATSSTAITGTNVFLEEINYFPGLHVVAIKTANYLRVDAIMASEEIITKGKPVQKKIILDSVMVTTANTLLVDPIFLTGTST